MYNRPAIPAEITREVLIESGHRCAVCGAGCPLERAHIIPWHKSREHKAEDLICLCANCHQRADLEKWGERTLREYKRKPWVQRQYENADSMPEPTTNVVLTIEMELENFDGKNQRWLQHAIAGFLEISPNAVRITSMEKSSVKVTIELPTQSAERLLNAYKRNDPVLDKYLAPMVLLDLRRERARRERIQEAKRSNWGDLIVQLVVVALGILIILAATILRASPEMREPILALLAGLLGVIIGLMLASRQKGIEQVYEVMEVIQRTLQSRLDAEVMERKRAIEAESRLQQVLDQVEVLEQFYRGFQKTIERSRETIEDRASEFAQTSRHDFKRKTHDLNSFVRQFDTFKTEFEPLEEEPRTPFSPRVLYIRGIAALYANRPDIAKQCLEEVVRFREPQLGETKRDYNCRVANAYYYLGVIESNFGNYRGAIDSFEEANERDPQGTDVLTRVVTAEAYVMMRNFAKAGEFIAGAEKGLRAMECEQGRLHNHQLRLQSRAALIRANMAMLEREENWHQQVQRLLKPVYVADPQYYYATATLAQVHADQGDSDKAQELFNEAYTVIERSGHLLTVTEARSRILLMMIAGMCCKHGPMDEKRSEVHLNEADSLRSSLPTIDSQVCTVFSPLSKRNESSDTICHHIELIRKGDILLIS
jgi:tetratricopeptide (TPR) repeat protein